MRLPCVASPSDATGNYEVQLTINDDAGNNSVNLLPINGSATTLDLNKWLNIWVVVNNSANTYDVYLNDGGDADAGDKIGDDLAFRNPPAANNLVSFLVIEFGDGSTDDFVRLDNIAFDLSGENLTNPIPTPAALPAGLAMLGLCVARRRRR